MNNEPASALQKASFIVLLFIAAALAYLIVRDHRRAQEQRAEAERAAANPPPIAAKQPPSLNPSEMKSSFAPLRPRVDTNTVRILTGRTEFAPPADSKVIVQPGQSPANSVTFVPPPTVTTPVPAAFTSGRRESQAGASLVGRVTLRGTPPPEIPITLDALCGRLHPAPMTTRHFVVSEDAGLANVFVYIKSGAKSQSTPQPAIPLLDNVNCEFQPYVLGVRAGQSFQIRNSDGTLHNVHSLSKGRVNREFNIGLPVAGGVVQRTFEKPEVFVQIKCEVHPWMFAYIGVVDHPWFAVTDANGQFALPAGLPAGHYTVAAVHVKAGEATQEITIGDAPTPPLTFTLDVPKTLAKTNAQ